VTERDVAPIPNSLRGEEMVANSFVAVVSFCELVYCFGLSLFWGEFFFGELEIFYRFYISEGMGETKVRDLK